MANQIPMNLKYFDSNFQIFNNGRKCAPEMKDIQTISGINSILYSFEFTCDEEIDKLNFTYSMFFDPGYLTPSEVYFRDMSDMW